MTHTSYTDIKAIGRSHTSLCPIRCYSRNRSRMQTARCHRPATGAARLCGTHLLPLWCAAVKRRVQWHSKPSLTSWIPICCLCNTMLCFSDALVPAVGTTRWASQPGTRTRQFCKGSLTYILPSSNLLTQFSQTLGGSGRTQSDYITSAGSYAARRLMMG